MKLLAALLLCASSGAYAQVRISFGGDTLKGNIKKMIETEYIYSWSTNIKIVYTSDMSERSEMARFYDEKDILRGKWVAKFDDKGHVIKTSLYCNDTPCQVFTHRYDLQGREIEGRSAQHLNTRCNSFSDWLGGVISNWVIGTYTSVKSYRNEYDKAGRLKATKEEHFSIGGDADTTIETTGYRYDGNNWIAVQVKRKTDIKSGSIDTGIEITSYKYDSHGNKVEEDVTNNGYSSWRPGFSKSLFRYDARHNLVETKTYGISDSYAKPHSGTNIGTGSEYTYDSLGNRTSHNFHYLYREDDGSETQDVSILYTMNEDKPEELKEYDKQGNLIKKTRDGRVVFIREIEY